MNRPTPTQGAQSEAARVPRVSDDWVAHYAATNELRAVTDLALDLQDARSERDEARAIVSLVNNSFGSHSYHTSPHPAELIEDLKWEHEREWKRAENLELRLSEAQQQLENAVHVLERVRVFVNSRERIKQPEGRDWFEDAIRATAPKKREAR